MSKGAWLLWDMMCVRPLSDKSLLEQRMVWLEDEIVVEDWTSCSMDL